MKSERRRRMFQTHAFALRRGYREAVSMAERLGFLHL